MTNAQASHLKAVLEEKRQGLVREIHVRAADLDVGEAAHDPIDHIQSMTERDEAVSILRRLSRTLASVDDSLRAISEDHYGMCVECGRPLGLKRLETIPWASHCVSCQELLEQRESIHNSHPASFSEESREAAWRGGARIARRCGRNTEEPEEVFAFRRPCSGDTGS